jgi:hypothetical protein
MASWGLKVESVPSSILCYLINESWTLQFVVTGNGFADHQHSSPKSNYYHNYYKFTSLNHFAHAYMIWLSCRDNQKEFDSLMIDNL